MKKKQDQLFKLYLQTLKLSLIVHSTQQGQLSAGCSSNHFPPLSEAQLELDPGLSCVW